MRAGLRMLKAEEEKLQRLSEVIDEGEASGFVEDFDFDTFLVEKNATHRT
jgi:antitoxin ParD1/3/4